MLHSPSSSICLSPAAFGILLLFWMPTCLQLAASHGVLGSWLRVSPEQCVESEVTAPGCGVTKRPTLSVPSEHVPIKPEHFQHKPPPLPFLFAIGPYFWSFYLPSLTFITDLLLPSYSLLLSFPSALSLRSMCFAHIFVYLLPGHPGGKGIFLMAISAGHVLDRRRR